MSVKVYLIISILICTVSNLTGQYKLQPAFPNLKFNLPLDFQDPRDGTNRVFVVTQEGIIYVFQDDSTVSSKKVFLDLRNKVITGSELGLLGMTFHPDFKNNGYFFVDYTAPSPLRSVIARFTVAKNNPDSADINSELIILEVNQPTVYHNAGQLAFGADGYLYIGFGDGGTPGDSIGNAQNMTVLLGKILRINIDTTVNGNNYMIPFDNPFVGITDSWREEIWASGFRNPWRYSFDPVTGWCWVGDVGQDTWEEIDILKKGGNFGWNIMEGFHCFKPSSGCDTIGLTLPIWEYKHDPNSHNAITGGYVYRGAALPDLYGKYIYADYENGKIWALDYDGINPASNQLLIYGGLNITSFGTDSNNELFICAFDSTIYKIVKSNQTIVEQNKPNEPQLSYNFPNPFNSRTAINLVLKDEENVKIEIYNAVGEKITTLINETLEPGPYKLYWDAANYPSGTYIYQLTAGSTKIAGKMVLLK
jgi:glucose/arabinose dehydrogenase